MQQNQNYSSIGGCVLPACWGRRQLASPPAHARVPAIGLALGVRVAPSRGGAPSAGGDGFRGTAACRAPEQIAAFIFWREGPTTNLTPCRTPDEARAATSG
jgi:hypothetical protein